MVVLRAIAKYNEDGFDIQHQDVAMAAADPDTERAALMHASPAMSPPVSPVTPSSLRAQQAGHRHRAKGKWYHEFAAQMSKLFSPKWRRTVTLMWTIWGAMALAYTMFNVWLPAVLESRQTGADAIRNGLWDLVLYALAGCPGSVIGAWMIQTQLGRRRSLAICTVATAVSVFAFVGVRAGMALTISSMFISLTGTAMYAVLCEFLFLYAELTRRRHDARDVRDRDPRHGVRHVGRALAPHRRYRPRHRGHPPHHVPDAAPPQRRRHLRLHRVLLAPPPAGSEERQRPGGDGALAAASGERRATNDERSGASHGGEQACQRARRRSRWPRAANVRTPSPWPAGRPSAGKAGACYAWPAIAGDRHLPWALAPP